MKKTSMALLALLSLGVVETQAATFALSGAVSSVPASAQMKSVQLPTKWEANFSSLREARADLISRFRGAGYDLAKIGILKVTYVGSDDQVALANDADWTAFQDRVRSGRIEYALTATPIFAKSAVNY